jgi:transcriptional regulator with XRE-family HTH domain
MKRADSVDTIVGHNIRIQRLVRNLSQQEVGTQIGVSFQQMQKYEKGTNRVSAGRLWRLATLFNVPIDTFYATVEVPTDKQQSPLRLISTRESLLLAQSFAKIKNRAVRRSIVGLVRKLAGQM